MSANRQAAVHASLRELKRKQEIEDALLAAPNDVKAKGPGGGNTVVAGNALELSNRQREGAIRCANRTRIQSAATILSRNFKPVQWSVQGILPEGVSILSGDPKIGKSWFLLQACVAVAAGKPFWPGRPPEVRGDALLLALEDNERRMQRRLTALLPRFAKGKGDDGEPDINRLQIATEWPRSEEGIGQLRQWLQANKDCRIVVVDTVSAFRRKDLPKGKSAYAADYEVGEMFKPLAREFSCSIVLVMHNRKQSSGDVLHLVSGTQGMTGSVDNVLVMRRTRGRMDAALFVDGRDIENPVELALHFDEGYWSSNGKTVEESNISQERRELLSLIERRGGSSTAKDLIEELPEKKGANIRKLLCDMVKAGQLTLINRVYSRPR